MKNLSILSLIAIAAAAMSFAADGPTITYTKSFPGSVPAYVAITVAEDGSATYTESAEEEPEPFELEAPATAAIFQLANALDRFQAPMESGLKVANTGMKTFRWENGGEVLENKFNHTNDENARAIHDWFEQITDSQHMLIDLARTARFDRLGVHEVLLRVESAWEKGRLVSLDEYLPLVDRIAKNESYLHMARDRAAHLGEEFRKAGAE